MSCPRDDSEDTLSGRFKTMFQCGGPNIGNFVNRAQEEFLLARDGPDLTTKTK